MTTFVLVHGGWHGGWCWRAVAAHLRAAGHAAVAPTLSGLADRAHLLTPAIGLETHIQDVVGLIDYEELTDVVLVGHSYAGLVVAGAADRMPGRLTHLVYLDAFVPADGQALFDLLRPERRDHYLQQAAATGDGWRVPPPPPEALGVTEPERARWLAAKLTPQPLASFKQTVRLANPAASALPRHYVHCTSGPLVPSFAPFAERYRADPAWRAHELTTGHDAMLTAPDDLAAILLQLG